MRTMILLLFIALATTAVAAPRATIDDDGVTHVHNSETPSGGVLDLEMQELWRAGGDDEDLLIGTVSHVLADEAGRLYVLDSQLSEIQVFSPDGDHVDTLGRAGEGPGEFVNGGQLFWTPDGGLGVIQWWPGKIVLLKTDGTPGPMFSLTYNNGEGFQAASRAFGLEDRIVLSGWASITRDGEQIQQAYIKSFDMDSREVGHYHLEERATSFGGFAYEEHSYRDFQSRWTAGQDGRVAAALDFRDYAVTVWNPDGGVAHVIERPDYAPVPRTDEEIDSFQQAYDRMISWNPGATFAVDKNHQAVESLEYRDDGLLWIRSGRDQYRSGDTMLTGYDVYDRDGAYVRRVNLVGPGDPTADGVFLIGDRVVVVTDMVNSQMQSLGVELDEDEVEPISIIVYAADLESATP